MDEEEEEEEIGEASQVLRERYVRFFFCLCYMGDLMLRTLACVCVLGEVKYFLLWQKGSALMRNGLNRSQRGCHDYTFLNVKPPSSICHTPPPQ